MRYNLTTTLRGRYKPGGTRDITKEFIHTT